MEKEKVGDKKEPRTLLLIGKEGEDDPSITTKMEHLKWKTGN